MDRVLKKKKLRWGWILGGGAVVALIAVFVYQMLVTDKKPMQTAKNGEIKIYRVVKGDFQEFFLSNCYVAPVKSMYIDSEEYGIVEHVDVEQGDIVKKGQVLLTLQNDELQSQLSLKEASLKNAVNDEENIAIRREQMTVRNREQLLEMDYQISTLKDEYDRKEIEFKTGAISEKGFRKAKDEIDLWTEKREILDKSSALDLSLLEKEDEKIKNSIEMLQIDLKRLEYRIGTLTIASPAFGQITTFDSSVGEMKNVGSRIAQLDIMDTLKLKSTMDEYYLPKIAVDTKGSFTYETGGGDKATCGVTVSWISPDVKNNSFEVELKFDKAPPANIRVGQRFAVRVGIGEKKEAVLLEQGQFYQSTGGAWVYVVDPMGKTATKRNIEIGKSNPDWLEVLKGLTPGERVVISDYSGYNSLDRINLK